MPRKKQHPLMVCGVFRHGDTIDKPTGQQELHIRPVRRRGKDAFARAENTPHEQIDNDASKWGGVHA